MPVELLWTTGGTGSMRSSVTIVTPSPVPAPGYICLAVESGEDIFNLDYDLLDTTSPLPYQALGNFFYGEYNYAVTVIWKVESGSFSGSLTAYFNATLANYAFTAWAVTGATMVYYDSFALPKRCVLVGGNLLLRWMGYVGYAGDISCPDLTLVRADTRLSDGPQSYLFSLSSDRYSSFSDEDWLYSSSIYSCEVVTYRPFDTFDYWFIAHSVYAPDPVVFATDEYSIVNLAPSIAPIDYGSFYDIANVTFSPVRPSGLIDPNASLAHDLVYAVHARGAGVRPNASHARSIADPTPLGDTWPILNLLPGAARVSTPDEPALLLAAGLGSMASPPTAVLSPGTPSAYMDEPTTTYTVDPLKLSMESPFGYQVPSVSVSATRAPGFHARGVEIGLFTFTRALASSAIPELALEAGTFAIVPTYSLRAGSPAIALLEPSRLGLEEGLTEVTVASSSVRYALSTGRASVFLRGGGSGTPLRPLAPCVIRLAWGSHAVCLKDYEVFEVQMDEARHTIRLGLALSRKVERAASQLLSTLEPGRLVHLDTPIAGGFNGWYIVQDISSVSFPQKVTFDILLRGEEHSG